VGPCPVLAVGGAVCALGAMGFARWSWSRRPVNDPPQVGAVSGVVKA
jgi:hypothetical protein